LRVFKFLAQCINPQHSVETRVLGLRLLRVVFETAGMTTRGALNMACILIPSGDMLLPLIVVHI